MSWKIKYLPDAVADLRDLDNDVRNRILKAILKLEKDPKGYGEHLGHKLGMDLTGFYKLRSGDYRIVYCVFEQQIIVTIVTIDKREGLSAYKKARQRLDQVNEEMGKIQELIKTIKA